MESYSIGKDTFNLRPKFGVRLTFRNLRIVPSFLVQTGDKTGTGGGGESIYGGACHIRNLVPAFVR